MITQEHRKGFALAMVLVVVAVASIVGLTYLADSSIKTVSSQKETSSEAWSSSWVRSPISTRSAMPRHFSTRSRRSA
jgi:type II secretory pathway component PulK